MHNRVQFFVTPWTAVCLAPLSMEFSRREYLGGLPFPSPGDLSDPGLEPWSPALQADSFPSEPLGKLLLMYALIKKKKKAPSGHLGYPVSSAPAAQLEGPALVSRSQAAVGPVGSGEEQVVLELSRKGPLQLSHPCVGLTLALGSWAPPAATQLGSLDQGPGFFAPRFSQPFDGGIMSASRGGCHV